jgi:hypothetical protein
MVVHQDYRRVLTHQRLPRSLEVRLTNRCCERQLPVTTAKNGAAVRLLEERLNKGIVVSRDLERHDAPLVHRSEGVARQPSARNRQMVYRRRAVRFGSIDDDGTVHVVVVATHV